MSARVTHPRFAARARPARPRSWWARAWSRAVEESSYGESDLRAGRSLARAGAVGGLSVGAGEVFAAVEDRRDLVTSRITLPALDETARTTFAALLGERAGRLADLLAGDLPIALIEEADEVGVELLPYGGEFDAECSCDGWTQPCRHALAVLIQAGWLLDDDPFVLLALRGLARDGLVAGVHATRDALVEDEDENGAGSPIDLDLAVDAAARAAALIDGVEHVE